MECHYNLQHGVAVATGFVVQQAQQAPAQISDDAGLREFAGADLNRGIVDGEDEGQRRGPFLLAMSM